MNYFTFPNYGVLTHKFSNEELAPIWNEINEIKDSNFTVGENFGHMVHSNIEHKFKLIKCRSALEQLMVPFVETYEKETNYVSREMKMNTKILSLTMDATWVNFQKKHDFVPIHTHPSVYSFVIWMRMPYEIKNEVQMNLAKTTTVKLPGHFQFNYLNVLGGLEEYDIPVDSSYENVVSFFPARLNHTVYPFYTSDEYRISVSGNFSFLTN